MCKITRLIIPISVLYSSELRKCYNFLMICYLAKPFMFYTIQTTYGTFISKNWSCEQDVIAPHNLK